ncbi:MAG TPA: serine/threonine-protein kinase [Steroidobacteraceae bacterium]|nr:serine/threonine-protein kinase [Steroidobacteraceae bacterium]
MSLRLLVMAASSEQGLLVRKHVEIEWPDATVVEFRVGEDRPLEEEFTAAGFDAVVIVAAPPAEALRRVADDFRKRPEFAPIVFVCLQPAPQQEPAPQRGLHAVYGRKIDRGALLAALRESARERRQALTALRASPDYERRYRFGSVTIRGHRCIKTVGSGGMCSIYLAESERAGRVVVLKVFNQVPDVSDRIVGFDRFIQEYEIVAALDHENIVRIFDLGIADDHAYIAMEHFPAGDLRRRMKTPLSGAEALDYLRQIASALEAIHAVGVLHRDLKPANVMLRDDGSLCLIDFGLAKANASDAELTGAREIFGTPYYMSPEQGHAEPIDVRSDLYSLGVIFYEMLTGQKPFKGATAMEVIYKHKRADLPELAPEFAAYKPILVRLLAKSPADRFQSARELLTAIDAAALPA